MPDEEIVIHKIVEEDRDTFFRHVLTEALAQHNPQIAKLEPPIVPWIDGIAMSVGYFPETAEVVKEKLQGRLHIGMVIFTRIKQGSFKADVAGNSVEIHLVEMNNDPQLVELGAYLKTFKPEPAQPKIQTTK